MNNWKYALIAVFCLTLATGMFLAASGSCQTEKGAVGEQPAKSAEDRNTTQPPAGADAKQGQESVQVEKPQAREFPPVKRARGTFNPTEGC